MNLEWIGCSARNFRPGRPAGMRPEAIVIHVIVGSLASADSWFNDPVASVSAHYGVGRGGAVHQYVKEEDTAFHAGIVVNPTASLVLSRPKVNPNFYTIGIEHEGQPDDDWTSEQGVASSALIANIAARWSIPIDSDHVIGHHTVRASKPCPGDLAKVAELIAQAKSAPLAPGAGFATAVRTISNVRLRRGFPNTAAPVVKIIPAGTLLTPTGSVTGESIAENAKWFRDADGNFLWAGGTDAPGL